jgi:hypothetical protein
LHAPGCRGSVRWATEAVPTASALPQRDEKLAYDGRVIVGSFGHAFGLTTATGISFDGLTICGYDYNYDKGFEGWVAHIPEPGALLRFLVATIGINRRHANGAGGDVIARKRRTPYRAPR